jgi:hypothetical protein
MWRDGYLYFTANQLHRQPDYHDGKDLRVKPYSLFRVKIEGSPVRLKRRDIRTSSWERHRDIRNSKIIEAEEKDHGK